MMPFKIVCNARKRCGGVIGRGWRTKRLAGRALRVVRGGFGCNVAVGVPFFVSVRRSRCRAGKYYPEALKAITSDFCAVCGGSSKNKKPRAEARGGGVRCFFCLSVFNLP